MDTANPLRRNPLLVFWAILCCGTFTLSIPPELDTLPSRLENHEFWSLIETLSEPEGYFRSDNLVSNEITFQQIIPDLVQRVSTKGVYLGVGPEQNFSYIAAIKPKIAFIPDIRRGNLRLQLMYKALFELSEDRADFLSHLFTRKRPANVDRLSTARQLFIAFHNAEIESETGYSRNLNAVIELLIEKRGFTLSKEDITEIGAMYRSFYSFGPDITYASSLSKGPYGNPTYAELMTAGNGTENHSYLSSEGNFAIVKDLETKNLVIPVVADLAGPKAVRAIGKYLYGHKATVSAFYVSNVERYLDNVWGDFCDNVAALPLNKKSTFIRWTGDGRGSLHSLGSMLEDIKGAGIYPN